MKTLPKCTFLALMLGIGCAHGQNIKTVKTGEITRLEVSGNLKITIVQSPENKIELRSDDNIDISEKGDKLSLGASGGHREFEPGAIKLFIKDLSMIEIQGNSVVSNEDTFRTDRLKIEVSGASRLNLTLVAKEISSDISGASKVKLTGKSDMHKGGISGASVLDAVDLQTKETKMDATGMSKFSVWTTDGINASATGMSRGEYKGNPKLRNIDISGNSGIHSIDDEGATTTAIIGDDTLNIRVGDRKITITEDGLRKHRKDRPRKMKHVWNGFELGVESFMTPDLDYIPTSYDYLNTNLGKSWFFGLNFLESDIQLIKTRLSLASGFGIGWENFRFTDNTYLRPGTGAMMADTFSGKVSYNNWNTFNLSAPFLIKYNSGPSKGSKARFHFATGVIVSYSFQPDITLESTAKGYHEELTISDNFNYNPFRVTATVRVGYGWLRLFANYGLTPVFDRSKAPDVRVCAVGMTLVPF